MNKYCSVNCPLHHKLNSLALLGLVRTTGPEVLLPHPDTADVLLQLALLLRRVDAGQVHPVVAAVLLSLVPVGLQVIKYLR